MRLLGSLAACTLAAATTASALSGAGCGSSAGPRLLALMPGIVNRPDNRSLRYALLRYGIDQFCAQMTRSSAPITTADGQPVTGRYCDVLRI